MVQRVLNHQVVRVRCNANVDILAQSLFHFGADGLLPPVKSAFAATGTAPPLLADAHV